jgi:hypothetical protein
MSKTVERHLRRLDQAVRLRQATRNTDPQQLIESKIANETSQDIFGAQTLPADTTSHSAG